MRECVDFSIQTPVRHLDYPAIEVLHLLLEDGWAEFFPNHAPFVSLTSPGAARLERGAETFWVAHSKAIFRSDSAGFRLLARVAVPMKEGQTFQQAIEADQLLAIELRRERSQRELALESRLWHLLEG